MSSNWHSTWDELGELELENRDTLTVDQRIQLLQVKALLSIGQELSLIHHEGIAGYDPG